MGLFIWTVAKATAYHVTGSQGGRLLARGVHAAGARLRAAVECGRVVVGARFAPVVAPNATIRQGRVLGGECATVVGSPAQPRDSVVRVVTFMRRPIRRISTLYRIHFADVRRELLFLSGLSFLIAFALTRGITRLQLHGKGHIKSVKYGELHIHHQVFGILMLVGSGHAWLHLASHRRRDDRWLLRTTTVVYGVGCALTLDELALWLNMEDVYWDSPGREIIDAGILVTALASVAAWGAPFFAAVAGEVRVAVTREW